MIRLDHLTIGYRERHLVEDACAEIRPGRLTALIGRNGTGKSSLLRVLGGIDQPISGAVIINGQPLRTMSAAWKARSIAFVTTQRVRIANLRCRDVVGMGRAAYTDWIGRMTEQDRAIVSQSLRFVGMEDYADRTLDTMSDGECQRIMIARALAQQTPVILLDEPTSFLDIPNRHETCQLLQRLAHEEGKLIIFSTHELDLALSLCDDIMLIDPPRMHFDATQTITQSGIINRLFHLQ